MAIREYIGARYIPRFRGTYNVTSSYEALDVVDNGQGTSYIAKIPTPAGIPLTNTTYWALYGASSGAIVNLQGQIDDMKDGSINGSLQNQINTNASNIQTLSTSFDGCRRYPMKNIMVVTDSYGTRTTPNSKKFNEVANNLIQSVNIDMIATSGAGLVNGNIVASINNYSGDGSIYDTVIYVGGANDEAWAADNYSQFPTYFANLRAAILTKFPNVKNMYVMCAGQTFKTDSPISSNTAFYLISAYRDFSRAAGFGYVENAPYILRNTQWLEADMCHPNGVGVDMLGRYLALFINNGIIDVNTRIATQFTDAANRTYNIQMLRRNNVVRIVMTGTNGYFMSGSGTTIPINGTLQTLGTFTDTLINSDNTGQGMFCASSMNDIIFIGNGVVEKGESRLYCYNRELHGYLYSFLTSGVVGGFRLENPTITFTEF